MMEPRKLPCSLFVLISQRRACHYIWPARTQRDKPLPAKGVQIDGSDIFEFYRTSVSLSEFYLEKSVHEKLNKLFRLVNEMKKRHNEWEAAQNGCDETRKKVVQHTYHL